MAHVVRLIVAALLLWAGAAHALVPIISGTQYKISDASGWHESREASCEAFWATFDGVYPVGGNGVEWEYGGVGAHIPNGTGTYCRVRYRSATGGWQSWLNMGWTTRNSTWCPANSTASGGACACNSGYHEDGNACVADPSECEALAGQSAGSKSFEGRGDSFYFCDAWNNAGGGKCVAKVLPDFREEIPPGSGHWISTGTGIYTGSTGTTCDGGGGTDEGPAPSTPKPGDGSTPTEPDPGTAAPSPCPAGQAPGEVGGTTACYPRGTDGNVEETKKDSSTDKDGNKTDTTQTTKCTAGTCTTTTTECKTPAGSSTATCTSSSTSGSASGTCKPGNGLAMCGEGTSESSFSGNCAQGFIAKSEDAVLNAMAMEQHKRNCETFRTDTEPSTWLQQEGQRTDDRTATNPHNETVNVGPSNFDTSDALGGGACSLNKTFEVHGFTVTLPFDSLCSSLSVFGYVLVAVSMLLAARIVARG